MNSTRSLKHSVPDHLVLIGASTGGPSHLEKILVSLETTYTPAIVIAQHMDEAYIPTFIKRLDSLCQLPVELAEENDLLQSGHVYICGHSTAIRQDDHGLSFSHLTSETVNNYNPDINTLFESASHLQHINILAVILTGIGDDGVKGCCSLSAKGASCICENEESAIVYGMPQRAKEVVPDIGHEHLNEIITAVKDFGGA